MNICIPIKKKTIKEVIFLLEKVPKMANMVEVWFEEIDDLKDSDIKKIIDFAHNKQKKLIYKYKDNKQIFGKIIEFLPDFIDIDIKTEEKTIMSVKNAKNRPEIIISHHDFSSTPPIKKLIELHEEAIKKGADVVKIATTALNLEDSLRILEFLGKTAEKTRTIALCMGKEGRITRETGLLFGNWLTYVALSKDEITADGQLTVEEFNKLLDI